jgi:hypothetical protein
MDTSHKLEARLLYLNRIHNLLDDLQRICIEMSERTPDRHLIAYQHIPLMSEDLSPISGPEDMAGRFALVGSYRLVFKDLPFYPPELGVRPGCRECWETEIIARGLRKMIGDLTGTWHRGPLWDISGAGLYTELKREYILRYLRYFLIVAEEWSVDVAADS